MQFILLLLSFLLLSSRAAGFGNAVVDTDGEELKNGQLYYAVSWLRGAGAGGLELVALNNESCPLYVAKARPSDELGQPLAFFPEDVNEDTIRDGHTLYIMFTIPTNCKESTVWRNTNLVTTGGTSSSSFGGHDSRFALYKHEGMDKVYLIRPCPCSKGGGDSRPTCLLPCFGALGVGNVNGKSVLRVRNDFLSKQSVGIDFHAVMFQKVKGGKGPMVHSAAMHAYA